jgi:hypothetical protein
MTRKILNHQKRTEIRKMNYGALIKALKNRGPRVEPYGIPDSMGKVKEISISTNNKHSR